MAEARWGNEVNESSFLSPEASRNITVAKSDKYLCWKRGCVDRWLCFLSRLSDTFWQASGYCNGFSCHLKLSSTEPCSPLPTSPGSLPKISAGCWPFPPELLRCFIHWVTGMSSHPDHVTEERKWEKVREKQFHRTFLRCFSNLIWLLISLKLPREGAVFCVYLLFHLQISSILTTDPEYQKVSEVIIQNEQAHGIGLFGREKAVAWALVKGLAGAPCLAAAVFVSLCPIFMAPEPQPPRGCPHAAQHWARRKCRHRKSDGAWCCDLNPTVWWR